MKKTLELAWGVIRRPAPTFRRIKEEKPLGRGIVVFLLGFILMQSSTFFLPPDLTQWLQYGERLLPIVGSPKVERIIELVGGIILNGVSIVLLAFFVALIAWLFKKREKGSISSLVTSFLFINVLAFIWVPILYGISFSEQRFELGIIINGLFAVWSLGLLSVAIGEMLRIPVFERKWRKIVFSSTLAVVILAFVGLAEWSYYFERSLIKNIEEKPETSALVSRIVLATMLLTKHKPDRVIRLVKDGIEQEGAILKRLQFKGEYTAKQLEKRTNEMKARYGMILGVAYLQKQDYLKAEEELSRYLAWNSKHAHAYNLLGLVYYRQGKYEKTINCLQEALKLEPKNREYRRNLEKAKARLKKSKIKWIF